MFLLVVKGKVPSYLGSASFVGVATAIYAAGGNPADVTGAMFWVGVLLLIVGLIIHSAVGAKVIHRALPPGGDRRVVMLIGFNLAPVVANTYWPQDQWVAS
jgi:xanthine/uracil permease